jgi:hypothetical protein
MQHQSTQKISELKVSDYPFETCDFLFYLKNLWRDRGFKTFYQCFNRPLRRSYSRGLIQKYAPHGLGLELGVGERTICPTQRTVLSDGYTEHGVGKSIAKVFLETIISLIPIKHFLFFLPNMFWSI